MQIDKAQAPLITRITRLLEDHERCPPQARDDDRRRKTAVLIMQELRQTEAPPISDSMVEAGLQSYSEGGCCGLAEHERREVVRDILEAASAKSMRNNTISAEWNAFNRVLDYLNTLETKVIAKKDIYHAVMEMRPSRYKEGANQAGIEANSAASLD